MRAFRPYAIALVLFCIWLTCQSCSSTHYRNKTKEKTQKMANNKPQYAFYNNQIIMFENANN